MINVVETLKESFNILLGHKLKIYTYHKSSHIKIILKYYCSGY